MFKLCKCYRPKLIQRDSRGIFRNKNNGVSIVIMRDQALPKERTNCVNNIKLYNIPVFLEEKGSKSIRAEADSTLSVSILLWISSAEGVMVRTKLVL